MSATEGQLERRLKLRKQYEAGVPVPLAAKATGLHTFTCYRWYRRWIAEAGPHAVHCECGRSLIHSGRCKYRDVERRFYGRAWSPPVYDGPDFIGKAMTAEEAAAFRARAI